MGYHLIIYLKADGLNTESKIIDLIDLLGLKVLLDETNKEWSIFVQSFLIFEWGKQNWVNCVMIEVIVNIHVLYAEFKISFLLFFSHY